VDPEGIIRALNRAAQLMADLGEGTVCRGYIDEYPGKIEIAKDIPLRVQRVNDVLGIKVPTVEMLVILERLQMTVKSGPEGDYKVTPPTFRVDITREIDLIEEIARLYGYDRIPVTMPSASGMPKGKARMQVLEERLRALLMGAGFSEVINYSFVPADFPSILGMKEEAPATKLVRLRNPLTEEQSVMRTTLVYSLLDTLVKNGRNGNHDLKIFETGKVFLAEGEGRLPQEKKLIGGLISGLRYGESWHSPGVQVDFFDLKGLLENIFADLHLAGGSFSADVPLPFIHPGRSCGIKICEETIGFMGEIHPLVSSSLDLRNRAYIFEINLEQVMKSWRNLGADFREISRFPSSSRDVAFVVALETDARKLLDAAFCQDEELLEKVSIFDVYTGKNVPEGTKSLGLRFSYRSWDRTLTDEVVNEVHGRIVKAVIEQTKAKIRG
ncbi:MAG: phenylalanine--tRNA ligase subunit beta, partial [Syntrophales bacterium]|nr:phenylalanine--tRNA ligase subunit beta [Syntrophales bacterium]